MENKRIVIGNMKMFMTISDISNYLKKIDRKLGSNVILCPSSIYIPYFLKKDFAVGAQNIYDQDTGPFTGEISAYQIKNMGVDYVILGHHDRRIIAEENDILIHKKVVSALKSGVKVILCIGETKEEKELYRTNVIIKRQLLNILHDIPLNGFKNIIIAYEPRWAIGTNIIPRNDDIDAIVGYIKDVVKKFYQANIKVVYGGSINTDNIDKLNQLHTVDGFLVGKSCCDPEKFLHIVEVVSR